ncbi:ATP-grasp domain-containing protein [Halomonas organivorans]
MNILLTSVGRRSYLVEYFRRALDGRGSVIAVNSDPMTTGMQVADKAFQVPQVDEPAYIDTLLRICQDHEVKLVLSLFDIDLPYLARARNRFSRIGVDVVVSDPWVIDIGNDKWKTCCFLSQHGINVPRSYINLGKALKDLDTNVAKYPMVIKPRWGMGSLSIFTADNHEELLFFYEYCKKQIDKTYMKKACCKKSRSRILIQEHVTGEEYGVDILNSLSGKHLTTVVKKKLAMRSGETDIAEVVSSVALHDLSETISQLLKHRGNLDIDVMKDDNGNFYILEMNPRFGGGYPFSHLAGARFPDALLDMMNGESPQVGSPCLGVITMKSIQPIIYTRPTDVCHYS